MGIALGSEFWCCRCGERGIPIARRTGKGREAGHLKRLFCLKCGMEWNHAECKEFSHYTAADFKFEYENNNFDELGNRRMPYGEFRSEMNKKGVELP